MVKEMLKINLRRRKMDSLMISDVKDYFDETTSIHVLTGGEEARLKLWREMLELKKIIRNYKNQAELNNPEESA
jgi:hypothetical protein